MGDARDNQINVRVGGEMKGKLRDFARRRRMKYAAIIITALEEYLARNGV